MSNNYKGLHPILWIAAIAITLASAVGVAKMAGWLDRPVDPALVSAAEQDSTDKAKTAAPAKRASGQESGQNMARNDSGERYPSVNSYPASRQYCNDCGVVESVRTVQVPAKASGVGAVAGGVVGGVLGNQVGEGSGKDVATVAGAVIGGLAGHQVEKKVRTTTHYEVNVLMQDGTRRSVGYASAPAWSRGDAVQVRNGTLSAAPPNSRVESL
ncbi:MAG: hypothetical protein JWL63_2453 [Rhodocyclales bacterium]|nr:hypothetical protein [Rhodocyclales bacterium]